MSLDEEILIAKHEKELNKKVASLMENLEYTDNSEESLLTLKYCETAEMLREFNYNTAIFDVLKETKDYEKINSLKEEVAIAKEKIECNDLKTVLEGYEILSKQLLNLVEQLAGPISTHYRKGGAATEKMHELHGAEKVNNLNAAIKKFGDEGGEENYQALRKHGMSDKQIDSLMASLYKDSKKKEGK